MNPNPLVLAIGAAGPSAGLVVPELAARGARVRAFIRNPGQELEVRHHGATEVAVGDLNDHVSLEAAMVGVDAVFYISPIGMHDEATVGKVAVEVARKAGVRRFVFSSLIDPGISAIPHHWAKVPIEEAILASDMEYVLLHPTVFFQNLAGAWPKIVGTGTFVEPWSAKSLFSRVDYRDVAEVAGIALTDDRLTWGTFELCAEGHHSGEDLARMMGEVLGREIVAAKPDPREPGPPGMEELRPMIDWYDDHGMRGNALTLRAILGREPRTLRAYLEELAEPHPVARETATERVAA